MPCSTWPESIFTVFSLSASFFLLLFLWRRRCLIQMVHDLLLLLFIRQNKFVVTTNRTFFSLCYLPFYIGLCLWLDRANTSRFSSVVEENQMEARSPTSCLRSPEWSTRMKARGTSTSTTRWGSSRRQASIVASRRIHWLLVSYFSYKKASMWGLWRMRVYL